MQWHYFIVLLWETIIKFYEQDSEADIILSKIYISKHIRGLPFLTKLEEQGPDLSFHRKKKMQNLGRKRVFMTVDIKKMILGRWETNEVNLWLPHFPAYKKYSASDLWGKFYSLHNSFCAKFCLVLSARRKSQVLSMQQGRGFYRARTLGGKNYRCHKTVCYNYEQLFVHNTTIYMKWTIS